MTTNTIAITPANTHSRKKKHAAFKFIWDTLACFRSVQLAIVLLVLLLVATMLGVLIPQHGLVEITQIKQNFGNNYRMMNAMGLFDVYSSSWFIGLEVLFFFNMLFGSFQWLRPAYMAATQVIFKTPNQVRTAKSHWVFSTKQPQQICFSRIKTLLQKRNYRVYLQEQPHLSEENQTTNKNRSYQIYATKAPWSRLGPVVVHFGIVMMLLSSVFGAFFGFKAQKLVSPGESFKIEDSEFFKANANPAVWLGQVPDWRIKVNDFKIEYYPDNTKTVGNAPNPVKQYYADLSVHSPSGKLIKQQTISVNHPLSVGSTVFYQASFKPTGKLFLSVNGKPRPVEINTTFMNRQVSYTELSPELIMLVFPFFVQQDPGVQKNNVVIFLRDKEGFVGQKPGQMPPNLRLAEGQIGTLHNMTFEYKKAEYATGLQIKHGPEVPWIYTAFIIIAIGMGMSIFSQRQLWITLDEKLPEKPNELLVLYKTRKAKSSFYKELKEIEAELKNDNIVEKSDKNNFNPHKPSQEAV
ncbi:MAG: cytochrome c biogenesis protein ResB [Cyanobacteria bacterium P01_H01_bin.74]